jgi:tetratricopeptide (TPR) repeat protein
MSLIQDALKKAQEERDRGRSAASDDQSDGFQDYQDDDRDARDRQGEPFFSGKRMVVYSLLFLLIVVSVVFVTVIFKPPTQSTMKVLHGGRETPAVDTVDPMHESVAPTTVPVTHQPKTAPVAIEKPEQSPAPIRSVSVKKSQKTEHAGTIKPKVEAREVPEKVKQAKPQPRVPGKSECDRLAAEGDALMGKREFVLAVDRYKKALEVEKRVSLYLKLYSSFKAMKNNVLARAYIDEGLRDFPDSFSLNKVSAILYIRDRDFDHALKNIETALGQNRGDYAVFTYKGLCHFHKKEYEKALLDFKASLDINTDAVENYYYIGLIYDNVRDYPKALEFYRVFFKLNPETENFKHREWVIKRINELERYLR